jgi:hypothetical protein
MLAVFFTANTAFAWQYEKTIDFSSADTTINKKKNHPLKLSASTKFVSQHFWRALSSGTAPCIEPTVSLQKGGLILSTWASYAVDNSYREIDFYIEYRWKFIQLGLFDNYCPGPKSNLNDFSRLEKGNTLHSFEAQALFFGPKKYPFVITTGCFIGGWDYHENGDQMYSSYLELAYPFKFKDFSVNLELGATPHKSFYASKASLYNYGFTIYKDIKISDKWSLPTSYKLIYNAEKKDLYFVFSFSLT